MNAVNAILSNPVADMAVDVVFVILSVRVKRIDVGKAKAWFR